MELSGAAPQQHPRSAGSPCPSSKCIGCCCCHPPRSCAPLRPRRCLLRAPCCAAECAVPTAPRWLPPPPPSAGVRLLPILPLPLALPLIEACVLGTSCSATRASVLRLLEQQQEVAAAATVASCCRRCRGGGWEGRVSGRSSLLSPRFVRTDEEGTMVGDGGEGGCRQTKPVDSRQQQPPLLPPAGQFPCARALRWWCGGWRAGRGGGAVTYAVFQQ